MHPDHDVTTLTGLLWVGWCVLEMVERAVLHMSPDCNSWINMGVAVHKRSRTADGIWGDESLDYVLEANRCALVVCWLIWLCVLRNVRWTLENPKGSMLFCVPQLSRILREQGCTKALTYLGAYGFVTEKPLVFYSNIPRTALNGIQRSRQLARERLRLHNEITGQAKQQLAVVSSRKTLRNKGGTEKHTGWNKNGWVCGTQRQRESLQYPKEFCEDFAAMVNALR